MTALTEGMTPAQFLTALNNNYTEYWGTGGVADILSTDGYVAAINASFGETVALNGQRGFNFASAVNGKFNTFTHILEDDCESEDIDATKWDVLNLDPVNITFDQSVDVTDEDTGVTTNEKNLCLAMNNYPSGAALMMFRNRIKSKESIRYGSVTFSLLKQFKDVSRVYVGLFATTDETLGTDDPSNRIYFYCYGTDNWHFGIKKDGVEVYTIHDIHRYYLRVQIVITPENKISLYGLTNKAWVQIGVTQTQDLGALYFCASSEGYYKGRVTIREFWMTSRMFSTIRPGIANEVSPFGYADGTTDNAALINAASGDVTLKDGVFLISESIKNQSNKYIRGTNAIIKLANNALDNVWRNSDFDAGNVNVGIIGSGHFILDGNSENNNDAYETYTDLVAPETVDGHWEKWTEDGYHYVNVIPLNINGFEFSNLNVLDYCHWNFIFQHAKNGIVKNIFINHQFTTTPSNQDGINILWGCENITVSNIKTTSDDDAFVIGCPKDHDIVRLGPARNIGISNIKFNKLDVLTTAGRGLLFLVSDGNIVDGISYDNVTVHSCYHGILFGYPDYDVVPPTKEEFKNIKVRKLTVNENVNDEVLKVQEDIKNVEITDFVNNTVKDDITILAGLDVENFTLNGVLQEP